MNARLLLVLLLLAGNLHATVVKDDDGDVEQSQDQDQSQSQVQGQSQAVDSDQANQQSLKVYGLGASSGDSTSLCQKVRDLRFADALLFGIRWDVTDKDCVRLGEADKADARGQHHFANTLRCTVPVILEAFGNDVNACKDSLEESDVISVLRKQVQKLQESNKILQEERHFDRIECDKSRDRLLEECTK